MGYTLHKYSYFFVIHLKKSTKSSHLQTFFIFLSGTSSVQTNMWLWCDKSFHFDDPRYSAFLDSHPILNWIWPVPKQIADENDRTWSWTPAKGFYPMIEVLMDPNDRQLTKRKLYDKYTRDEIVGMYRDTIQSYWDQKRNIVIGTEALDEIVRSSGEKLLQSFSTRILPKNIYPSQITVVVSYRNPKADHLVSLWHQSRANIGARKDNFYDWITKTNNNLGVLDALGMVKMFLDYTDWNVVLLDLKGLKMNDWDESTIVACNILNAECLNRTLAGPVTANENAISPIVTNVRKTELRPNVSERALGEMELALIMNDCFYLDMLHDERLTIYYPVSLDELTKMCSTFMNLSDKYSKPNMLEMVKNIAIKHGPLSS